MSARQVFVGTLVVLLTLLGAYLVVRLLDILVLLVIAFIFASAISPAVSRLNRRLSLGASIAVVYLGLILVLAGLLTFVTEPLVSQTGSLVAKAPDLLASVQTRISEVQRLLNIPNNSLTSNLQGNYTQLLQRAPALLAGVLNVTLGVISGVAGLIIVMVMAFYWLLERREIESTWFALAPTGWRGEAREMLEEIEVKLGGYVRGQLILGVIVGVMSYVGLLALSIPYALVLALIAGISELIPLAGPIIGAVPAVLVGFAQSPARAVLVAALYILIQQLENHLLVPKVMQHSVGLSPLAVLFAVLSGGTLLGIIGALLSVPVASTVDVILRHTLLRRQTEHAQTRAQEPAGVDAVEARD